MTSICWIFDYALARVNISARRVVMLGDSWATDIEGALGAGIRAVWLNRFGRISPNPAVAEVASLTPAGEVFGVLTAETRRPQV